jgi:alkanesulfonate monooxygenase SsuD/methylene tetrahydromethanopterin reductase-like flavin-dependent oxidoreductase (luciferase family)
VNHSDPEPLVTGSLRQAVARLVAEAQDVLALVVLPWENDLSARPDLRSVRAGVRRHLADAVHPDVLADVLLVVGELVENAYRHTASPRRLRVSREGCAVRVEVSDGDPTEPALHFAAAGEHRRHGLLLVHQVCREWGFRPTGDGKTMWGVLGGHPAR